MHTRLLKFSGNIKFAEKMQ